MKYKNKYIFGFVMLLIIIIYIIYNNYYNKDLYIKTQEVVKIDKQDINNLTLTDETVGDRGKILDMNGTFITKESFIFLKGKCNQLEGKEIYYDEGKLQKSENVFDLKYEYLGGLSDYVSKDEIEIETKEINNIFTDSRKDIYNEIANEDDYKKIIELLEINNANLDYSMEKYALILNVTGKEFNSKKNIISSIFKEINKKAYINENYLTGILYYYYSSQNTCDGFFDFLIDEFSN